MKDRDGFLSEGFFKGWFVFVAVMGVAFLGVVIWGVIALITWITGGGLADVFR